MNILSFTRKSNPQDLDSVLLFSSAIDQQTYGLKWDDLVVSLQDSLAGGAAGLTNQIQYNDNGAFAASPNFAWNIGSNALQINGSITVLVGDVTAPSFNGVAITDGGVATNYLDETGNYSEPAKATPAGADDEIQFNNGGAFGASVNLKWDGTGVTVDGINGFVNAALFNGVALDASGAGNLYLDDAGNYSTPNAAAGSDTQLQFNNSGSLSGTPNLTWDGTSLNATQFNGVAITDGGVATNFLDETGSYSSPAVGNDTELQFNSSGVMGSSDRLKFNGLTLDVGALTLPGIINVGNDIIMGIQTGVGGKFTGKGTTSTAVKDFKWINQASTEVFSIDNLGAVEAASFNGVELTTGGLADAYLNAQGDYISGGAIPPFGNDTEVQYNNAGVFGADSNFTWDGTVLNYGLEHIEGARIISTTIENDTDDFGLNVVSGTENFIDVNTSGNADGTFILEDSVELSGGTGTGLEVEATVVGGLVVSVDNILNAGTGYTHGDLITITCGVGDLTGTGTATFQLVANQFDDANMIRVSVIGGDSQITGIVAPPAGVNRVIRFQNVSDVQDRIQFRNNDGSSLAQNRILMRDNQDRDARLNEGATFWYDHIDQRWRQITQIG